MKIWRRWKHFYRWKLQCLRFFKKAKTERIDCKLDMAELKKWIWSYRTWIIQTKQRGREKKEEWKK